MVANKINRKERQKFYREQHQYVSQLPEALTLIPVSEFPHMYIMPIKAWRSKKYLVQMWDESNSEYPTLKRLSVCRVLLAENGHWQDQLTWDELQSIKREIGFGDWYAIEIYPRDVDVVNVANFRHLWLLENPLRIGWTEDNQ